MIMPGRSPRAGPFGRFIACAAGMLLGLPACTSQGLGPAVDWSLGARLSNRIEVETNRGLDVNSNDALITKAIDAGLVLDAETKNALFSADLGIAAQYHAGEDEDFDGEGRVDPTLRLLHRYRGKTHAIETRANLSLRATDVTQVEDTGTIEADTTQLTAGGSVRLEQALDTRNQLLASLGFDLIDFDQDLGSLVPNRSYTATAGWEHDLNATDTVDLSGSLVHFSADNALRTRDQVLALTAGFASQRTPRHKIRLRLGPALVRSDTTGAATDLDATIVGLAGFEYQLAQWQTALEVSHQVEPSSIGAVQSFIRAVGRVRYGVNTRESLTGQLSYLHRAPLSGPGSSLQSITFNPAYVVALTEDARLSLGYFLRLNHGSTGTGLGHRVTLTLAQNLDLLD